MAATRTLVIKALILLAFKVVHGSALNYQNGKTYKYLYETSVLFNDLESQKVTPAQKDVGMRLTLDVDVTTVFRDAETQLIKIKLNVAKATSASRDHQEQPLGFLLKYPIYFEVGKNSVGSIYIPEPDSVFSTNIKKGIISLFQLQEDPGQKSEIDVSGECSVTYTQNSPNHITKTKQNCKNLEIAGQFSNSNKVMGVTVWSKTTLNYEMADGVIQTVTGTNQAISCINMRASVNGGATASQKLTLQGVSDSTEIVKAENMDGALKHLQKELGKQLVLTLLPSSTEVTQCTENCESPQKLVTKLHDSLVKEKVATVPSAKAFVKMLHSFRNSGKSTIAEVLTSPDSYYIVPQLIDVATASQTSAAQKALMDLLVFDDDYATEHSERFLLAAAYSTHPGQYLIKDLLATLNKTGLVESVREPLLLATGAIIHTYCQHSDQCSHKVVKEFRSIAVDGVEKCSEDPCILMYLRSLGNAGLPDTVSTILKFAEGSNNSMVSITGLEALRRIPKKFITSKVLASLSRIFHQNVRTYDSSVRAMALDEILKNQPSLQTLRNILLSMVSQDEHELSTYVKARILDTARTDQNLRNDLQTIFKDMRINNYYILSQKGKSSAFSSLLAETKDINCSYSLSFETTKKGIMKRSGMNVNIVGHQWKQHFLDFGIYAEGLESLMGDEAEAETETETEASDDTTADEDDSGGPEAAAGMSLTLMGVLLRQVEFFRGMSGLLSAVWNAPSELTSALQGNLLLHDHSERIHLSNGLIVQVSVTGVASIDLSGFVSISLWNRNSESLIKNSGALYVEGSLKLESSELSAGMMFSAEGGAAIDFMSNAEFYEMPLKLCLQMKRPEFVYRNTVMKFEHIKGYKKYKTQIARKSTIPAESYFLNEANSVECKAMFKEEV